MKLKNSNMIVGLVVSAALVVSFSAPVPAEDAGFTLEDSIRQQIFQELKSNVQELYRDESLLVPDIDTSIAARVASTKANSKMILPAVDDSDKAAKPVTSGNIN